MIVSEDYIKVPGKMYKVKVQCVSTRRLTTMEWLIVNCAAKFKGNSQTATKTLKYVFEEVFQLTSSEILIKPCIESLMKEQAIQLDVGPVFDYSNLMFSQIRLTEKGRRMAEDGLFPGDPKELPLDIYYNPLSEKMNQFVGGRESVKGAIEFGTESDYDTEFPEEKITEALHKGLVGRGKFVASKLRIEAIECLASQDWEDFIKISVDVDSQGHVTTNPVIKEDSVKSLVTKLFFTKEFSANKISQLVWAEATQPRTLRGSGKKMKEAFLDVSRNGSVIGIDGEIYSLYKQTTSAFKQKTLFMWNSNELGVEKGNESTFIMLPFEYKVAGCAALNEKNESISFCKNRYDYDGTEIIVPMAFEDKQIKIGGHDLLDWIEEIIQANYAGDLRYLALYTLGFWAHSIEKAEKLLKIHWNSASGEQIIDDLRVIAKMCQSLGTEMIKLDDFGEVLWSNYESLETGDVLKKMSDIAQLNCFSTGSETQKYILKRIISRTETPKNYNELFVLLQSVGIRSHADALVYDDLISGLYTKELIVDTLRVILEDKYTKLPELFELDSLFNEYVQAIKELEFLVSGLKMFAESDAEEIEKAVENCADVALIQSYAAELQGKNAELLKHGVNVYTELRSLDEEKAGNFFANLDIIKDKVIRMMKVETEAIATKVRREGASVGNEKQRMYIIDTCALMHHPELLLYFSDEEFVRIPTKVIDELGKIKDMRSSKYSPELSRTATRLAYDIERKYLKLFNFTNKMRLMIENAELDLLPEELDKNVPDNQILSVALKYSEWDTIIISDDGVFRLTSLAQNIKAITGEEFIKEHEVYKKSLERWVEKFAKAGGTLNLQSNVVLAKPQMAVQAELVQSNSTAAVISLEESNFADPVVDVLPIRELKKYLSAELTEQAFALLQNNGIKNIGQFKAMSPKDAEGLKAKGKQTILRNNIIRAINKFSTMISNANEPNDNSEAEKDVIDRATELSSDENVDGEDGLSAEELLLANTANSIRTYFRKFLNNDSEKIYSYMKEHYELPSKLFMNICVVGIVSKNDLSELYKELLLDYISESVQKGKTKSISVEKVVMLAAYYPEADEDAFKDMVERCTTSTYQLVANKHYAQAEPTPKQLELIHSMLEKSVSLSRMVYVYMNSKMRGEINVDRFITELVEGGYQADAVMNYLKDYWILGKVKYVQDDGLVRVAPTSISNSRLMVFNTNRVYVNGENGWEDPQEGMTIYFKLQDYIEGGMFYIHYPCTDIAYSN